MMTQSPPTLLNDAQAASAAQLVRAIALSDFAAQIHAHEHAQLVRHLANIGSDAPCDCEDCAGNHKYPQAFYHIARQLAQFDAAKREATTTGEKRVALVQTTTQSNNAQDKFSDGARIFLGGVGRIRDYFYPGATLTEAIARYGNNWYVTRIEASVMELRGEMVSGVTITFNG